MIKIKVIENWSVEWAIWVNLVSSLWHSSLYFKSIKMTAFAYLSVVDTQTHLIQMKNPRQQVPGKYLERSFSQPDHRNRNNNSRNRNRSNLSDYLPRSSTAGYGQSAEGRSMGISQSAEGRPAGNNQSAEGRSADHSQPAERRSDGYSKSTEERSAGYYSQSAARRSSGYSQSAEGRSAEFRPSAAGNQNGGFNNQVSPRKHFIFYSYLGHNAAWTAEATVRNPDLEL